jgi:hypothetical protein
VRDNPGPFGKMAVDDAERDRVTRPAVARTVPLADGGRGAIRLSCLADRPVGVLPGATAHPVASFVAGRFLLPGLAIGARFDQD